MMNYVLTGGAGHITRPLAQQLIAAGHSVKVIGRNAVNLQDLISQGAEALIGSVEDPEFLTNAFRDADAVYTMVPPYFGAADWKAWIGSIGRNYSLAIKNAGIKKVVNLSSIGAHLENGCGPVSGLYRVEQVFNQLEDTDIVHLRPAFFYYNHLANIPMIKSAGITGGNYGAGTHLPMVAPEDIADLAADYLQQLQFTGKTYAYLVSDTRTTQEIAQLLGSAVGFPDLMWVDFTDEQLLGGLLSAGLPEEVAKNYVEMGASIRSGEMTADYQRNTAKIHHGKVGFDEFANRDFKAAYEG